MRSNVDCANMSRLIIVFFLGFMCLTSGWESGTQYTYKYIARSTTGIYYLKQQNAIIEIQSRVIVQSQDENTIVVKLTDAHIKRNGKYESNPYFTGKVDESDSSEIHGLEDKISDPEHWGAPFVIKHKKGSIDSIKIGENEPLWVVNYKKAIASQLQLDITGVRPDGEPIDWSSINQEEINGITFQVFEDSITGDCSNTITVNRLPPSKVYESHVHDIPSFKTLCQDQDKPVYEVTKTKDFGRCKSNPISYYAKPSNYLCSLDNSKCANFMQRNAVHKYIGCGTWPKLTYISLISNHDVFVKPFATETDALTNINTIFWHLEKKEATSSMLSSSSNLKEHKTLSHIFPEFEQDNDPTDISFNQPGLEEAYQKSPIPIQKLQETIYEALRHVAKDLKEKPDSESDNLERLSVISRALPMFSLKELRVFWKQIKKDDPLIVTLFIDTVAQTGSNPAIMLIKELIENKEIGETKATWAVSALGSFAKTPTTELLRELVDLYRSSAVRASKSLKQTTLVTLAELFHNACGDVTSSKRFAPQLGKLCDKKDPVVINKFLPILVKELESSQISVDKIVALTALGSFGFEEIIPILLPYIRGSQDLNDTAVRTRAVLSLQRVVYTVPEKVHPILIALASNSAERDEIRMAALGLLFSSNAPFAVWQKFASQTWFEDSTQVVSFMRSLFKSISKLAKEGSFNKELMEKANHALELTKPAPSGLPYSFFDIRSSHMEQGFGIDMDTVNFRVADEQWPVFLCKRYSFQFGPFISHPLKIFLWNFNMGQVWQNIFGKLYSAATGSRPHQDRSRGTVHSIWEDLNVSSRPKDKTVGLLHLNLMGSINSFYDIEKLPDMFPSLMARAMRAKSSGNGYPVSFTNYRMLAEYNIKFPTEMGLPLRFLANLPVIASLQGTLKADDGDQKGIKSDIASELSWKLSSELRVELPFNGNYIATGVDVRIESHLPNEFKINFGSGAIRFTWSPDNRITDFIYYHVKPYTITRNIADSHTPTLEDEKACHIISVRDEPPHREFPIAQRFGVNLRFTSLSELDFSDMPSFMQWLRKWDVNSLTSLAFVPMDVKHQEYHLRYKPEGTNALNVQLWYQYQYIFKSSEQTVIFQSGEDQLTKEALPEIVSHRPIIPETEAYIERIFKNIEAGDANFLRSGLIAEKKDGSSFHFNTTIANSWNSNDTAHYLDWHYHLYTSPGPNAAKEYYLAVCYDVIREWNKPPHYGFSKDILYMDHDEKFAFGEECDIPLIHYKARVYRDEYAAQHASNSLIGQRCQKDMSDGFMYGSPACEQARLLDQTYNHYAASAEGNLKNLPDSQKVINQKFYDLFNHLLYGYTVIHSHTPNIANFASLTAHRDPYTGATNITFNRPYETLVAHNARSLPQPFTHLSMYPLHAGHTWARKTVNKTYGGVSEAKCFVGPNAVYTFDGGFYNYTKDQCQHVLMTDCSKETQIAVLSHQEGQYKIVQVIYGNDTVELDPSGFVTINGVKNDVKTMEKDTRFEIRYFNKAIKAVVYPILDGIVMEVTSLKFVIKVQGSQVELSAPLQLRGKICGLCGDFNQEISGEFKTPKRCAVSSGELMAASFKLTDDENCKKDDPISLRLAKETATCKPFDVHYPTYLPNIDLTKPTKCTRYEKLVHESTHEKMSCQSVEYSAKCQPGCKPYMVIDRPFTFKCSGGAEDFSIIKKVPVPTACIPA